VNILEAYQRETAIHAGIESITALLAVGAEDVGRVKDEWNGRASGQKDRVMEYTCYNTLPAKNNILEMIV